MTLNKQHQKTLVLVLFSLCLSPLAAAQESDRVQIDAIKEKYWARGDDSEMGVVQNRLYTKEGKIEVGGFFGFMSTDPFLTVHNVGASVGYHLTEYLSVHFLGWKTLVSNSSALDTFIRERGATTNTNEPKSFFGGETEASILYGKLSLLGKKIIYYDFHLLGGVGATSTESGTYFTPLIGLGQQVWVSKNVSLRFDYRLMEYHENIVEKVIPTSLGRVVDERTNWTNSLTLGVSILFGGGTP